MAEQAKERLAAFKLLYYLSNEPFNPFNTKAKTIIVRFIFLFPSLITHLELNSKRVPPNVVKYFITKHHNLCELPIHE